MAQDDDRFEPRLGRSRRDKASRPTTLRTALMHRIARAGGNPRRLPSTLPRAPAQSARSPALSPGRFNGRGRGAKIAATFSRGSGWSFDHRSGTRVRSRRVTVKVRIVKAGGKAGGMHAHLRYLEREGVSREGEPGRLYSTFTDEADRGTFIERGLDDRHQFRIILAPEDGAAYEDLKPFTRDVMAQMEADLGTTLDWVAVDHHDTGHPHVHVVVRGVTEDGKILNIAGDYLSHGIRHRASEVLTRDLGLQTEQEVQRQLEHEVEAERLTRLDRTLIGCAENGVIDLRMDDPGSEFERVHRQLLIARARQLERMQLATAEGPLRWSLSPDAEDVLRTMGERGDIIKTMHRAMTEAKLERSPVLYTIHDQDAAPVVGRVVARGLADEAGDRRYLVIDGIDGRSHYADIGEAEGSFPVGSIERQIGAEGATWLDRQLTREVTHERADHGFGRDVRQALARRQQWLVEQGLMQQDGTDVLFRKDILNVLEQRELRQVGSQLSAELGKTFVEPIPGIRVDGVYRQAVDLASGRFAVIEKSLEFTLVPWRPVLERHLGRAVSGIPHGDDFDWTIGRGRGGPSL